MDAKDILALSSSDFMRAKITETMRAFLKDPSAKMTISKICIEAGVSRSSFYNVFDDLNDAIAWFLNQVNLEAQQRYPLEDGSVAAVENQLVYILEANRKDREFYRRATMSLKRAEYDSPFLRIQRNRTEFFRRFIESRLGPQVADNSVFYIEFYIIGTANLISAWAEHGMVEEPRAYAQKIVSCMPQHLAGLLRECDLQ